VLFNPGISSSGIAVVHPEQSRVWKPTFDRLHLLTAVYTRLGDGLYRHLSTFK
jgi:hypothetical protein